MSVKRQRASSENASGRLIAVETMYALLATET
jgi:hypothetical protein